MNKQEWQKHHGLTDEEMAELDLVLATFNGSIVAVRTKEQQEEYDRAIARHNVQTLLRLNLSEVLKKNTA